MRGFQDAGKWDMQNTGGDGLKNARKREMIILGKCGLWSTRRQRLQNT